MSENLDLVRSIYAAWERGDFSRFDWAHPEMEYVFADGPEPASGRGHDAMWVAWRSVLSAWRDHRAIAEEYRELDDGGILALTTFRGRGEASGIELTHALARGASVMYVREGQVKRIVLYMGRDRALADLGLKE
jgi:ketosteroid isomerase-like protein